MKIWTLLRVASAAFFFATAAYAQNPGTVTNHAFIIGKGAGTTGYTSLLCGSAQLAVGQSAADPICRTITGDVTIDAAGVTAIGATKVTSAMLNADAFSTAHTWGGQQTFVAPILGTPASGTLTNATGLPVATGISGLGTGVATALAVNVGTAGSFVVNGGVLGTPSSGTLTNATGLPIASGVSGLGANVATFLATPNSANLRAALTDETGTGADVFGTAPTISGAILTGTADVQQALTISGDITPSQIASNQNDYAPTGFSTASTLRLSTDASRNITGLAGGADGRTIIFHNVGAQNIVLTNQDAASTAANRFLFGGDVTLLADYSITVRYDATTQRWRAITTASSGGGGGTVTSATIAAGNGIAVSGTCTITTSGTCTVTQNAPSFKVRLAASQSVTSGTTTKVAFDTVDVDTHSWWDTTNKRYTPLQAGKYLFTMTVSAAGTFTAGSTVIESWISKNGTVGGAGTGLLDTFTFAVATSGGSIPGGSVIVDMNGTTDFVEVDVNLGGTSPQVQGLGEPNIRTTFSGTRVAN